VSERVAAEESAYGVDAARDLAKARRVSLAGAWTLIGWVASTAILDSAIRAPLPVWIATSAVAFLLLLPLYIWSVIFGERLRRKAAHAAGVHMGFRVDGHVGSIPLWLLRRGPEAVRRVMAHQPTSPQKSTSGGRTRVAELRGAVSRGAWATSIFGLCLLVVGVTISIVAVVLAIISAAHPGAASPLLLLALSLGCYAVGFPMLLAFARDAKRQSKPHHPRDYQD